METLKVYGIKLSPPAYEFGAAGATTGTGEEKASLTLHLPRICGPETNERTIGDSGNLLLRQYGNAVTYTADPTTPYDDIYVRFRLVNTDYQECYYDEHGDGGGDVYAWTQPFFAKK